MGNIYPSYIDTFVGKRTVGKFLRSFCIYLSYLQLNVYTICSVYWGFQVIDTVLSSDEDAFFEEINEKDRIKERWTRCTYLVLALMAFVSVGVMLHGIKTRQNYLMLPWLVYHIILFYIHFLKESLNAITGITHSTTIDLLLALKFLLFLIIILPVCVYYRKLQLDRLKREQRKRVLLK